MPVIFDPATNQFREVPLAQAQAVQGSIGTVQGLGSAPPKKDSGGGALIIVAALAAAFFLLKK